MQDNGTGHRTIVESGIYRLPCTSSVFVTAKLTDIRDLIVLRTQKYLFSTLMYMNI